MRLYQIAAIAVASFLFVSEALPMIPVSNHTKVEDVVSPGHSHQRLLRGPAVEYDNESEERGGGIDKFSPKHQQKLKEYAAKIGFDLATGAGYAKVPKEKMAKYIALYNKIYAKYK
ncbi:RxLR effector protein [Phytophthora megakarya]|uniref:RxLR effector protein n=1 Tax=Phytophthora megakarya TaxID=4795 RepID=A0A225W8K4_9STRA|nr:RxLR effector protein [Phytophthora megakarya]